MEISVDTIQPEHFESAKQVVKAAFDGAKYTDHDEHNLIGRVRSSENYRSNFEVVALDDDGQVIGYGMLTPVAVKMNGHKTTILALAPLAVHPDYQSQGVGSRIIDELESRATIERYPAISILGDPSYYSRFGYVAADNFNILSTLPVELLNNMIKPLWDGALANVAGKIYYPSAFFG
ncbi:acetyltransferase [Secundilactobacillus oryzae JCM 18671]|uniref:Acetyltransferase n=1 Tax=Secundilactobacillus oryzae JCM 18671 TaxID=1291743 RepID=A0A081BGW7_9LACO|nr:N-acetyltransferase [Secundilactobacillus oryzae]GAK47285.1 acetyltransferase [Secundilactobacillus oryzae JCM 18671]